MKRILLITTFLFFILKISIAQECTLSTECGDVIADWGLANNVTFVCEGEPFEVLVNPGTTMDDIDEIVWTWDDGQTDTVSDFSNQSHTYIIDDMTACDGSQEVYSITMEIFRFCADGSSCHFQTAPVAVKFKPRAFFDYEQVICLGNTVDFENTSCNGDTFLWNFGDGTTSTEENPSHEYLTTGTFQVTLMTSNECGDGEITQEIEVINPAISNPTVLPGFVNDNEVPFIICMDTYPSTVTIPLDGDSLSLFENQYEWQSLSGVEASYITDPPSGNNASPNIPDLEVMFSDTGMFQIILEVDNECEQPDLDTLFFHVLTGESLDTPNQPDACLTLEYTPENYNPNATYTINGMVETDFPITLGVGSYTVVCSLSNECGLQTTTDVFDVFDQEDVSILFPTADTTLCVGSDSVMILYNPPGGTWTGEHLIFYGDSVFFDPVEIGVFEIGYSKGIADCADTESITFTVEGVDVIVNDTAVCSTSDPITMSASPPGGIFSSTDCPTCIDVDTFIVSEMIANGLSSVEVNYDVESSSGSGCEGNNTFTVTAEDPLAVFSVDSIWCLGDPVVIDFSNAVGDLVWMIDGQAVGPPPFLNLSGGSHTIKLTASAGNCEDESSQDIYVTSPPANVSFTAMPIEGCADLEVTLMNQTGTFDNPSFEWYLDDSLFSTAIQPGTITLGPGLNDTTYTISLSAGNSCDGQVFTQTITVFPKPVPRFGPMQNYYCSGDTVTFSNVSFGGPMNSWLWDYGNGTTSTDSIPLQIIYFTDTIPTTYTISLTATNDCGTETFTYDLVVNPTDVKAFFNIDPLEGCVGVPICLTNLSTLGATVLWDFGDGNTSTQANLCHTYQQAGTFTIKLKAFGCGFDSIQQQVIIHPMPAAGFSNNTITCPGDTLNFINTSTLASNFLWDFGDGTTSNLNNPTHIFSTPGNYLVKLYATTIEGCEDSTMSNVTVLIPPAASFSPSTDSICVNDNITFTNISTPTPFTCFWDFGDGNFSNDCNPSHSFATDGTFSVTLIITNTEGCRDTALQQINVAPLPTPAFDFSQVGDCSPSVVAFINQTTIGESYLWDFGDGNTSSETTPSHTYLSGGTFTVQLTATIGVCSRSVTQTINVVQTPNSEIITPLGQAGCAEWNASFSASPIGNSFNYKWDFGDGAVSFDGDIEHEYVLPGIYEVTLIVDNNGNCPDTAFTQVEIFTPVEASANTIDNLCFGDQMGEINILVLDGTPDYEFDWSNGATTPDISNLPAGTYSVTIEDNNGCTWIEAIEIGQPAAPLSINLLDETIVTCYGGSDGGLVIEANGGTMDYDYLWENGNTTTAINNVPAGNYNITITDANNCVLEEILSVNQNDSISYNAQISNISCFGFNDGQINLDNFSGGVAPYFVTVPQLDSLQGTGFNNLLPDDYTILISDGAGCTQFLNTTIFEPPMIWIALDDDSLEILLGEEIEITSDYNIANPTFVWTPNRWLTCNDCAEPNSQPFNDVTYEVLMLDENGCAARDSIFITVNIERKIAIPSAFTPNNDGENDLFTLLGKNPAVEEVEYFQVFDRWGGMVHHAKNIQLNDYEFGWDGRVRGKNAAVGVYVFKAKVNYIDGESIIFNGQVSLLR